MTDQKTIDQVKLRIGGLIDQGLSDKQDIYSKIVEEFGLPRPTVRRIARDYRMELNKRVEILQSEIEPEQMQPSSDDKFKWY